MTEQLQLAYDPGFPVLSVCQHIIALHSQPITEHDRQKSVQASPLSEKASHLVESKSCAKANRLNHDVPPKRPHQPQIESPRQTYPIKLSLAASNRGSTSALEHPAACQLGRRRELTSQLLRSPSAVSRLAKLPDVQESAGLTRRLTGLVEALQGAWDSRHPVDSTRGHTTHNVYYVKFLAN